MKASELKQGETYGTIWGIEMKYVGCKKVDTFNPMTDEREGSEMRYMFDNEDGGTSSMAENEVERFVSNGTVEISTKRIKQIMDGAKMSDDKIDEAAWEVEKLVRKIEDMEWNCDSEVYETLLKISKILSW